MKTPDQMTTEELKPFVTEYYRRSRLKAIKRGVNSAPKHLKPCEWCGKEFGVRDMRVHIPHCPKKPKRR